MLSNHIAHRALVLLVPLLSGAALGCNDGEDEGSLTGDYANCGSGVLDVQKDVCDDLLTSVVGLCGFDLTVDPCACTDEIEGCTDDAAWLADILECRDAASDCVTYIDCLSGVGVSPSGCTSPSSWDCLSTAADATKA